MKTDWRFLSKLSFIEGASLLILLFLAMPLKYLFGFPLAVKVIGTAHGVLFMALIALIALVSSRDKWPKTLTIIALISSSLPFGMFFLEAKMRKFYLNTNA
jgi:integral membrane protein